MLSTKHVGTYLIFGHTGAIGNKCVEELKLHGKVICASRNNEELDSLLADVPLLSGVVWTQGLNGSDRILNFSEEEFSKILEANLLFIVQSLNRLINLGKIGKGTQLVIVSSMWSHLGRPNKLSYMVSKAALSGLVKSLAIDLAPRGVQVNALLPGPILTPMTLENISIIELERIVTEVPIKRLITLEEIAKIISLFATGQLAGVNGQELVVDGGWGMSKLV